MKNNILKIHEKDNVIVALTHLTKNQKVLFNNEEFILQENIPAKHKFTATDLSEGDNVLMYGVVVGRVEKNIPKGSLISVDNIKHSIGRYEVRVNNYQWRKPDISHWKNNIIVQMELLNSEVDHKDYMCDKTPWGVELVKRIGSPNFKLLYDIYHMQIDEGDVIRTISTNYQYFGHYHTAGVPGRHEIDESQELYYPAIMKAIVTTGFKDYVAQEFLPTRKENNSKIASLKKAVKICDV